MIVRDGVQHFRPDTRLSMPRSLLPIAAPLLLVLLFVGIDVTADLLDGASFFHVSGEALIIALASFGLAALARHGWAEKSKLEGEVAALKGSTERWKGAAERWESQARAAVRAFSQAVDDEFDRWKLTTAEREIALLLLKGVALKDIAGTRGTSERTVRQQAATVYQKAGVEGRAELASYFLDALSFTEPPPSPVG